MNAQAIPPIEASVPGAEAPFNRELVRQLRAVDSYGSLDGKSDEEILGQLVLTKEQKREIPVIGDPDEVTIARVKAFYNAVAVRVETETKKLAVPFVQISHEGFGRALVIVSKLVVLDRTLRDVHRFGFPNLAKLEKAGEILVNAALETAAKYPDATED